jgi:hypothetical protein
MCLSQLCSCISCTFSVLFIGYLVYTLAHTLGADSHASFVSAVSRRLAREAGRAMATNLLNVSEGLVDDDDDA